MSKVIAITNQKGGVGKTTTAINLGAALAKEGKKILIIDLDEQANASIGLGLERELVTKTSYDLLLSDCLIEECVYKINFYEMCVIPASSKLANIEIEIKDSQKNYAILYDKIKKYKNNFDYILLDCPPSLGLIVDNALYASDSVIIPVECEFFALDALTQMVNKITQMQKCKKQNKYELVIEGVLLTKLDNRNLFGYKIKERIIEMFPLKTFNTIINRSGQIQEAPMYGKSVIEYAVNSRSSREYRELAKEIIKNNEVI